MTLVRLEPGALRSRVKHSTTDPLRSLGPLFAVYSNYHDYGHHHVFNVMQSITVYYIHMKYHSYLGFIGKDIVIHFVSELCYKGAILQSNYWKMTCKVRTYGQGYHLMPQPLSWQGHNYG